MKKRTKILIVALISVISMSFIFSVSAFALSTESDEEQIITEVPRNAEETNNSLIEDIVSAFESYVSEILSLLAFVGSLIIMLCYKKGLMPVVNDGLKALKSGVKAINEKSESFNEHAIGICESIDERLNRAEEMAEVMLKSTELVDKKLSELQSEGREREKLSIILSSQIDMLYEIFMSASLPQYLKDSVGEKIGEMKAALGKEANNESNA